MAIPNRQLFLDRFIEYNVERYQDKPKLVAVLQGLTLDKINITNFQVDNSNPNRPVHFYDVEMPGVFIGANQKFIPADVETGKLFTIIGHVDDENELSLKTEEGIYTMGQTKVASLLVIKGMIGNSSHVFDQIQASLKYSALETEVTYTADKVKISNETIFGQLTAYESLYDGLQRYNGQYRADGTIRAL